MTTSNGPIQLTPEARARFEESLPGDAASRMSWLLAVARAVAEAHGQDPESVTKITISMTLTPTTSYADGPPFEEGGPVMCTIFGPGQCGCVQDPPGVSYPCEMLPPILTS